MASGSGTTHYLASGDNPVTRKQTEIWLVGQMIPMMTVTKLPSKNEVMALFFHYKEIEKKWSGMLVMQLQLMF
jgi:hypothetical protein